MKLAQEEIPKKEAGHIRDIVEDMRGFVVRKYGPGKTKRHFHPKMHGCVQATFTVQDNLPDHLKKGLFKEAKQYPAWIRFSSAPPKEAPDKQPSGLGMAIKLINVEGTFIKDGEVGEQDFVMTTSPILSPGHVANYRRAMKMLIYGFPHHILYLLDPTNWRRLVLTLKFRKRFFNVLEQTYFSGAPILFESGNAVKYSVQAAKAGTSTKPRNPTDHFLQDRLINDLQNEGAAFDFLVQFQEDVKKEPVEDTSCEWKTTFHKVASIDIPSQQFSSQERMVFGENLQFSPWNALADHRPLGGINRARREVYAILSAFRRERNEVE